MGKHAHDHMHLLQRALSNPDLSILDPCPTSFSLAHSHVSHFLKGQEEHEQGEPGSHQQGHELGQWHGCTHRSPHEACPRAMFQFATGPG